MSDPNLINQLKLEQELASALNKIQWLHGHLRNQRKQYEEALARLGARASESESKARMFERMWRQAIEEEHALIMEARIEAAHLREQAS